MNFFFLSVLAFSLSSFAAEPSAKERVSRAQRHLEGETFQGIAAMRVVRGTTERKMRMKFSWKERKYALIRILEPKKDAGTANLRINTDLWQFLPKVNRIIHIPSSMMLQSWMGSDFSNDDLVRGGSLRDDYTHKELGREKLGKNDTVKIECLPKKDAPVVWGKIIIWVRKLDSSPVKQEFYSEKGKLIKVMEGENHATFEGHTIPLRMTMKTVSKGGDFTVIDYEKSSIAFDQKIPAGNFTQESLRKSSP